MIKCQILETLEHYSSGKGRLGKAHIVRDLNFTDLSAIDRAITRKSGLYLEPFYTLGDKQPETIRCAEASIEIFCNKVSETL